MIVIMVMFTHTGAKQKPVSAHNSFLMTRCLAGCHEAWLSVTHCHEECHASRRCDARCDPDTGMSPGPASRSVKYIRA